MYKLRPTLAGQAAARAVTLTVADIGSGWTGGAAQPDLRIGSGCSNYHPTASGIVLTGAAASEYKQSGLVVHSDSAVMQTAAMLRLDWRRSIGSPHFLSCLRASLKKSETASARFVALRRLAIPPLAPYTTGYRLVLDVTTKVAKIRMAFDVLAVARGKTEIFLSTTMPLASVPTLFPNELVMARMLIGRIRP
jgi:hypothetical protein